MIHEARIKASVYFIISFCWMLSSFGNSLHTHRFSSVCQCDCRVDEGSEALTLALSSLSVSCEYLAGKKPALLCLYMNNHHSYHLCDGQPFTPASCVTS